MGSVVERLLKALRGGRMTAPRSEEEGYKNFVAAHTKTHVEEETLRRYWKYVNDFKSLCGNDADENAVGKFRRWAEAKYKRNSLVVVFPAINYYLGYRNANDSRGEPIRIRIPTKDPLTDEEAPCPDNEQVRRFIGKAESVHYLPKNWVIKEPHLFYAALSRTMRDVGWSNVDIAKATAEMLKNLPEAGWALNPGRRTKTHAEMCGLLEDDTVEAIQRHLAANQPQRYIFEARPAEMMSRQQILLATRTVAQAANLPIWFTPRVMRRWAQTEWDGDPKDYMVQFGLKDPKTSLKNYKKKRLQRMRETMDRRKHRLVAATSTGSVTAKDVRQQLLARFAAGYISQEAYELALRELGVLKPDSKGQKDSPDSVGYIA